jgi:hypothetical protein
MNDDFKPRSWSSNGPLLVNSTFRKFCPEIINFESSIFTQCANYTILPVSKCFAVGAFSWEWFFKEEFADQVFERLNTSQSFFAHLHNKMGDFYHTHYALKFDSKAAYITLAKQYCPKVYDTLVRTL